MRAIIHAEGLGKEYRIGAPRVPYGTLRESISRGLRRAIDLLRKPATHGTSPTMWALRDVSFDVAPGEVVGVIGRNGAGKSTLLKILSRITEPTTGAADLYGRVGSLLEVGTGFHPELTGWENIYLNGALMGMKRAEISRRFDEIVAFAEVDRFLDTPVKHYSSGMYTRLAFAVAAHLESEILLIDEVLAVGDAAFQAKCIGKMAQVARAGRTVLFVSHNMQAITSMCRRAILLEEGRLAVSSDAVSVVERYLKSAGSHRYGASWEGDAGDENVRLHRTNLTTRGGGTLVTDQELRIQVWAEVLRPVHGLVCAVEIWSSSERLLAYSAYDDRESPPAPVISPGPFAWELAIPPNTLAAGTYYARFDIGIHAQKRIIDGPGTLQFTLENLSGIGRRVNSGGVWTQVFRPAWRWQRLTRA